MEEARSGPEADGEMPHRLGENESRFRDANERIEATWLRVEASAPAVPFVCECGRPECVVTIRLTLLEYEKVRADSRQFVCSPGHEITGPDLGRVVEKTAKFVIMEKLGIAGEVAESRDSRTFRPQ
jgi:hypothetical protein